MSGNSNSPNCAENRAENHHFCLDMVNVEWRPADSPACSESAIVLEIWSGGAILNTSLPIPVHADLKISANRQVFGGDVVQCTRDFDFGFLVQIEVKSPEMWFPQEYLPEWRLPAFVALARV